MRIAICDDEQVHRENLKSSLTGCAFMPEGASIVEYSEGKSLIQEHKKDPHDILFLDIEMEGMSGIETGRDIRILDSNVIIIYITGHEKYVFKSFRIEPFDYILKPIDDGKIADVLRRAVQKLNDQYYIVDFKWQDNTYALRVCDIVYLESNLRHVKFATMHSSYKCVGKLVDFECRLSPYGFVRCHQSFLINMSYIKCIEKDEITTTLGYNIDMSAGRKQECLNAFNNFITKYRV